MRHQKLLAYNDFDNENDSHLNLNTNTEKKTQFPLQFFKVTVTKKLMRKR
jgi:hypothetical protein